MKSIVAVVTFSLLIISCHAQNNQITLPVNDFDKAITNNNNVQVLDVRTAAEYNSGHLKKSLQADWYNPEQFKDRTSNMDKSKPVYVYCQTGIKK